MKRTVLVSLLECITLAVQFVYFILWAFYFGAGSVMDAFWTAYAVPLVAASIISEPLIVSLVPVLVKSGLIEERESADRQKTSLFIFFFITGVVLSILMFFGSAAIIKTIAPGLPAVTSRLGIIILKILSLSFVFRILNAVLTGFYYSREMYYWPALVPAAGILVSIAFLVLMVGKMGILALAWGLVLGVMIQTVLMCPALITAFSGFSCKWRSETTLFKNLSFLVAGSVYYKSDILVDRYIASYLPAKSISYLGFGHKIANIINRVVVSGLLTTRFAELSRNHICDPDRLKKLVQALCKKILFFGIPLLLLIVLYTKPVIVYFFARGAYTIADSDAISSVILAFSGMIFFGLLGSLMANTFYAIQQIRLITAIGIVSFSIGIVLKIIMMRKFSYLGVASATSIYFALALLLEMVVLQCKGKFFNIPDLMRNLAKYVIAAGSALLAAIFFHSTVKPGLFSIFCGALIVITLYLVITFCMKSGESRALVGNMLRLIAGINKIKTK